MSQPSWIGQTLSGRYKIEELVGQGGMSSVYKGMDPNLKRVVAIKLIHPHLTGDQEFVRRFETEASAVAQLRHPNIIQVFDFNNDGNTYYMVLEFVPGETLQARLKRLSLSGRLLSPDEIVRFGASICDAANYAHKRGLIHRDIKPANVMLNVQGEAILMDFGITKIVGATHHTATGAVIGTALYMSPEQIRGERPDHRVDIYSLGVMLFEMVSGHPPYEADSAMTIMMMHLNDPIPDLSRLRSDVPAGLKTIIEKALAKDPKDRYQTAAELASALRNYSKTMQEPVKEAPTVMEVTPSEETYIEPVSSPPPPKEPSIEKPKPAATPPSEGKAGAPGAGVQIPRNVLYGGGAVIVLLLLVFIASQLFGGGGGGGEPTLVPTTTSGEVAQAEGTSTAAIVEAAIPSQTATPTETLIPSPTSPPSATPTATVHPDLYVRINGITLEGSTYVVDYETFEYTETLPGRHVHFFFDTVAPENAGNPGSGPWILYGGPRPFKGYTIPDKPAAATEMCARVANADHSLYVSAEFDIDTGNCYPLPES